MQPFCCPASVDPLQDAIHAPWVVLATVCILLGGAACDSSQLANHVVVDLHQRVSTSFLSLLAHAVMDPIPQLIFVFSSGGIPLGVPPMGVGGRVVFRWLLVSSSVGLQCGRQSTSRRKRIPWYPNSLNDSIGDSPQRVTLLRSLLTECQLVATLPICLHWGGWKRFHFGTRKPA